MRMVVSSDHEPVGRIRVSEHRIRDGHEVPHQISNGQRVGLEIRGLGPNRLEVVDPAAELTRWVSLAVDLDVQAVGPKRR